MGARPPTADEEAFYQAICAEMQRQCRRFPKIRTIEIIAMLGRMSGYCVAMCYPDERDLVRATLIENMDRATSETAPDGPATAGRG